MKRKNRDTPGRRIAQAIIAEYKPQSVAGEMESYLGYEPNSREEKETTNRRNGYFDKTIKTSMGEAEIEMPRDRQASFDGFKLSAEQISKITDYVLEEQQNWQNRTLAPLNAPFTTFWGFGSMGARKYWGFEVTRGAGSRFYLYGRGDGT